MNNQTPMIKRYYKPYITNKRKGDITWQITSLTNYCSALTYVYWAVSGVDSDIIALGDMRVQYYIQFRKPKMSNA